MLAVDSLETLKVQNKKHFLPSGTAGACSLGWMLIPSWGLSSRLQVCLASSVLTVGSSPALTSSILLFLLSSLRKHSSATLRLLLPAGSVCSAFWKVDPDAEFPRIPGVEMAFILLMHLENKTHLQLSMFQGKKKIPDCQSS